VTQQTPRTTAITPETTIAARTPIPDDPERKDEAGDIDSEPVDGVEVDIGLALGLKLALSSGWVGTFEALADGAGVGASIGGYMMVIDDVTGWLTVIFLIPIEDKTALKLPVLTLVLRLDTSFE
jgi:hypothetical protein